MAERVRTRPRAAVAMHWSPHILTVRQALAAVAHTHHEACACTTCEAARGDEGALAAVLEAVRDLDEADSALRNGGGEAASG